MKLTKYDDGRATAMVKASTTKSSGFDERGQREVRQGRPRAADSARGAATARGPADSTRVAAMGEVIKESRRKEEYFCFAEHYCACYSFFYDIVNMGEQLCCKHQLAAKLAAALGACIEVKCNLISMSLIPD
ncbi:hypothetical protein Q3G72_021777 [Acer saccharum]|nr:hypothetical protein Q3G72_021777 [Acer saccharum]